MELGWTAHLSQVPLGNGDSPLPGYDKMKRPSASDTFLPDPGHSPVTREPPAEIPRGEAAEAGGSQSPGQAGPHGQTLPREGRGALAGHGMDSAWPLRQHRA